MSDDEVLPYPGRSAGDVDIEGGTIESLNRDVRTDETDSELDEEMQNMEVKRLEQALGLRETFFWFGVASASVVVLASCIVAVCGPVVVRRSPWTVRRRPARVPTGRVVRASRPVPPSSGGPSTLKCPWYCLAGVPPGLQVDDLSLNLRYILRATGVRRHQPEGLSTQWISN